MKQFVFSILKLSFLNKALLGFCIWLHNFSYKAISKLALVKNNCHHPKHEIMNYHKFFVENLSESDTVLDIGCGEGALSKSLAQKAQKVIAMDIKNENIEKAKRKNAHEKITYLVADATTWQGTEVFSCIVLSNVLEHIENRVEFLQSIKRLSPKILLRVPMIDRDWLPLYKKSLGFEYRLDPTHYIEYTLPLLEQEVHASGYTIESYSLQFGEFWGVLKSIV